MDTPDPDGTPEPDTLELHDSPAYPCGALSWWPELGMPPVGVAWGYTLTSARRAPTRSQ